MLHCILEGVILVWPCFMYVGGLVCGGCICMYLVCSAIPYKCVCVCVCVCGVGHSGICLTYKRTILWRREEVACVMPRVLLNSVVLLICTWHCCDVL